MNNRIKQLVEQAGFYMTEKNGQSLTQFAELILQDIDKIVDDLYHALPLEQAAVLLTLDENIKQHFYGVDSED